MERKGELPEREPEPDLVADDSRRKDKFWPYSDIESEIVSDTESEIVSGAELLCPHSDYSAEPKPKPKPKPKTKWVSPSEWPTKTVRCLDEEIQKEYFESTAQTCADALEFYNTSSTNKGEEYVMVRPRCNVGIIGDPFVVYRCNFWAKKPDDASATLFYADLTYGEIFDIDDLPRDESIDLDYATKYPGLKVGEFRVMECQKIDGAFDPDELGVVPLLHPGDDVREQLREYEARSGEIARTMYV